MERDRYQAPAWGRAVSTGGRHGYVAFVPARLPREVPLSLGTVRALSAADSAVGRLAGAGRLLPNPHLFLAPYLTEEALASSRIEGTQASLSDVFDAAAVGETPSDDVREVQNYVRALEHGLRRLDTLPISKRLLCEMHAILLDGVRGKEKTPGEFRRSQNWIGSPDNRPETALFVPPTVADMWPALDDWERYVHQDDPPLPLLVRVGLLHYYFETIHPFLDGNGRLGHLFLILYLILYLVEQGALPAPLLPLSAQLERHKEAPTSHACRGSGSAGTSRRDYSSSCGRWPTRRGARSSAPSASRTCASGTADGCADAGAGPARSSTCSSAIRCSPPASSSPISA